MHKIATLVKEAEVRGVLAGLVDAGHIKVASYEDLEALTSAVASCLPDQEYNLDDVLSKTAEVLEYLESDEGIQKEAGEVDEVAAMAAFGELALMKLAGEIGDEEFEKEAASIQDILHRAGSAAKGLYTGDMKGVGAAALNKIKGVASKVKGVASGSNIRAAAKDRKTSSAFVNEMKEKFQRAGIKQRDLPAGDSWNTRMAFGKALRKSDTKNLAKEVGKTVGLYGAGAAGAAVGGKALYDKYSK